MKNELQQILEDQYGLSGQLFSLGADQDINFKLETQHGNYLVKITRHEKQWDFIKAQNKLIKSLLSRQYQKPLQSKSGPDLIHFPLKDENLPLRVFPFIEGAFLAEVSPEPSFYYDFGKTLAELDTHLSGYQDPVLRIQTHSWAPERIHELTDQVPSIQNPEIRRIVKYFLMKHREEVLPRYHHLPMSLIHGDANDHNVLVENNQLKGLIDFGDMVYSARIHEVSIALAYALMDKDNIQTIAENFVKGYHETLPLSENELYVLYYLIPARLATSLIHSSLNHQKDPTNEYHQISAEPAESLIKKWLRINPLRFTNYVMAACGMSDPMDPKKVSQQTKEKIDKRNSLLSKSQSISYEEPIQMIGSALQYMYGADGKTYVDGVNNIPHVGHCHPDVVAAGQKQMARLNTNTRYIYDSLNDYAEKLLATFPQNLSKVFFVNSGSAATDLAIRLAKSHTKSDQFFVLDHAYHGNTSSAINLSPYKFNRKGGPGKPNQIQIISREDYGLKLKSKCKCKEKDLSLSINQPYPESPSPQIPKSPSPQIPKSPSPQVPHSPSPLVPKSPSPPAPNSPIFIAESIPGCAGQVMLSKDFMQKQVQQIRDAEGLYIADEVQTGFGRVGKHFWGFELYDVVPDIVILGKPIANGHPMGAVVCTNEVAASFETGMEFFSSFGGNPVSCEIAKAVLDVIEEEDLQQHAMKVGDFLIEKLTELMRKTEDVGIRYRVTGLRSTVDAAGSTFNGVRPKSYGFDKPDNKLDHNVTYISDVRGTGLFLGIELVKGLDSMEPDAEAASVMVNALKEMGFLLSTDGPYENVIKFKPPMCFSMENAEELIRGIGNWE